MTTVIITQASGQMCNQLWNFASIYAFCLEKKHKLINPAFFNYAKYFEEFKNDLFANPNNKFSFFPSIILRYRKLLNFFYLAILRRVFEVGGFEVRNNGSTIILPPTNPAFEELTRKYYFFRGWLFRNNDGMNKYRKEIRHAFRPATEYNNYIDKFWSEIDSDLIKIAVHIRHKDYREHIDGKYFLSLDQYKHGMIKWREMLETNLKKQVLFVIYSDETTNLEESLYNNIKVKISRGNMIQDLYSMARCDFILGVPSTFNQWASWYGDVPICELTTEYTNDQIADVLKSIKHKIAAGNTFN